MWTELIWVRIGTEKFRVPYVRGISGLTEDFVR